jgi:hypothetical protein
MFGSLNYRNQFSIGSAKSWDVPFALNVTWRDLAGRTPRNRQLSMSAMDRRLSLFSQELFDVPKYRYDTCPASRLMNQLIFSGDSDS